MGYGKTATSRNVFYPKSCCLRLVTHMVCSLYVITTVKLTHGKLNIFDSGSKLHSFGCLCTYTHPCWIQAHRLTRDIVSAMQEDN